jgi:hypothetical protein
MNRPNITDIRQGDALKKWYWLKAELVSFAKAEGVSYEGSKFDILNRLAQYLDGTIAVETPQAKPSSKFDWHSEALNLDTVITDSYKNSQNVRRFFIKHCGDKFHFSIPFMDFMKNNCGKSLQDAINEWQRLQILQKSKVKSVIPEGNQYNQYIRDFFADNPDKTLQDARHFWSLKRQLPLSKHRYERTDLELV